jgi:CRISPR-associated endonuclease Csn1
MKKILGLDLGTNSIGWALTNQDFDKKEGEIIGLGSRIIPMSQDVLGKFDSGVSISQTAERTGYRGVRRLNQRQLLRRERLLRVLHKLRFLPQHFADSIDFTKKLGQFKSETEEKIAYHKDKNGKHQFYFMETFNEMVEDFKTTQPQLFEKEKSIPYDWTIYYLRKKALVGKLSNEELAWLLLNFNQKRGYYQLRGEEEENKNKTEEFYTLLVSDVIEREKGKAGVWYNVILENGWIYKRESKISLHNWIGKQKEFIVSTDLNDDGTIKLNKENEERRSFRAVDSEKDWIAIKSKTEQIIDKSNKTVGCFIYETLLENPTQKVNGKLVRTIERKFYKEELKAILEKQIELNSDLQNDCLYQDCILELYSKNDAHRNSIAKKGFNYLFTDDIIFYQRPLKSKISLISDCQYETKTFKDKKSGELKSRSIKCIAKSNPIFQEFRLWQFISNLKIHKRGLVNDLDVTSEYISSENEVVKLFESLNDKEEISQKQFLTIYKLKEEQYRWNMVEDKSYPCNETRGQLLIKTSKIEGFDKTFFTAENTAALWHILYSVSDKIELKSAIDKFVNKHNLPLATAATLSKLKPYKNDYGSYSEKAIKKLLPLMRVGNYWNEDFISDRIKTKINTIIERLENIDFDIKRFAEVQDDEITQAILKIFVQTKNHYSGLNTYQACYLVYGRHSESKNIDKWHSPTDIEKYLDNKNPNRFKQHSLRNPIVEQVITETLRTVKDIWQIYGNGAKDFFDEIHIELGREMKNPADKRKRITEQVSANENTNLRIKAILQELIDEVDDIRPYSPSQQEILKIYEEGVYSNEKQKDKLDEIDKIRKTNKPSKSDIQRYKLWLEQGYLSPYTGEVIKLSELFTNQYQIEHIFPQSRFFDDSMTNKIICESVVNGHPYKDNQTAMEFIKNNSGRIVSELSTNSKTVKIFTIDEYEKHIETYYSKNRIKIKNLLSEDIPESFINRQLNDSRYISKVVKMYLTKIVREDKDGTIEAEATSKNVIPVTGSITSKMKQDWGLNDVWNDIVSPRFERLNAMSNSHLYGKWENKGGKNVFQTTVPDEIAKGFNKKRIDHRHHALDALVIACLSRTHINYLNNLNAKEDDDRAIKHELRNKICYKTKPDEKGNYKWLFRKPWETFTQETKNQLLQTIVSFKQNTRVINKTVNKYQKFEADSNGILKKQLVKQTKGENWAIRKPMHAETVSGKVFLKRIKENPVAINAVLENLGIIVDKDVRKQLRERAKHYKNNLDGLKKYLKTNPVQIEGKVIDKILVYETIEATATRKTIDTSFDKKKLEKITDLSIQKILFNHLEQSKFQNVLDENGKKIASHEVAFNSDGIDDLNKNIKKLNNGKDHQPIKKVRVFEEGKKFSLGTTGNRKDKYVETAKGTNLYFAIYQDSTGKRNYETIPLNLVIERQKQGLSSAPEIDEKGNPLLFTLSPNDLVYIPTEEEISNSISLDLSNLKKEQVDRIYKFVSCSGSEGHFVPNNYAKEIISNENGSNNKNERMIEINKSSTVFDEKAKPVMIKSVCIKPNVNRLGQIEKL